MKTKKPLYTSRLSLEEARLDHGPHLFIIQCGSGSDSAVTLEAISILR